MQQKRGKFYLAFAMYKNRQKPDFDTNAFNRQTSKNHSAYAGFGRFALL